jgi:hypothetical protein
MVIKRYMTHRSWVSQVFNIGLVDVDFITWGVPLFFFFLKWSKLYAAPLMGPKNPFIEKKILKKIVFDPTDPLKM